MTGGQSNGLAGQRDSDGLCGRLLRDLCLRLDAGGHDAPPELLPPVSAVAEVAVTARSVVDGHGPVFRADRESLRADVQAALGALGAHTATALEPTLAELGREFGRIPQLLGSADAARVLSAAATAGQAQMGSVETVIAAFDDLLAAYADSLSYAECELRVLQLRDIIKQRGRDWSQIVRRLRGALQDDYLTLHELAAVSEERDAERFDEPAGLAPRARLEACRAFLRQPAEEGEVVVWLAFENAALPSGHVRLGTVDFIDDRFWPEQVHRGAYRLHGPDEPHSEFDDDIWRLFFRELPEKDFVLARVELGHGPLSGAAERARALAIDLVRVAEPLVELAADGGRGRLSASCRVGRTASPEGGHTGGRPVGRQSYGRADQ
jgi:hypothetical protein